MKNIALVILLLGTALQTSCTKKDTSATDDLRLDDKGLSQEIAIQRHTNLSNIAYFFEIDLTNAKTSDTYKGASTISFNFLKPNFKAKNLTVDFEAGSLSEVYANGIRLSNFKYNKHFISIPLMHLKDGSNILKFKYIQNFSKTGSGLYKFKDETDNLFYLYTDFEPYDANLFAPMFDQPNLKATYSLNVKAPLNWEVISSTKESYVKKEGAYNDWSFPKSQRFSTYIFSMHAGPYKVWKDSVKLKSKEIPLKLLARQSIAKYVKPDFWFKSTKQGFNFFEQYFSTDYPYTKYDQIIVPDFNSGAMENVAAVTFTERFISREDKPVRSQRRGLSNTIFHEMAHMWFGNLVTMDWWNDLWLNESFATYMAYTGLFYNTEYTESWLNFFTRTKQWAYAEDQWRTTHPIEADIPSTNVATSNFDGITYGKGASSLKQLVYLIGEENFKKGLADYFKTYAHKNTIRKNFIDSLQAHTEEDLNKWTNEWLQNKGLNKLQTEIICDNEILKQLNFLQGTASGDEVFRTHKLQIALWGNNFSPKPKKIFSLKISGQNTTWKPKTPIACPKAVFPNWNDHAYIQVVLDKSSFSFISENLNAFDSQLFRSQFWAILNNMLRFGELAPEKVFPIIKKQLPKEKDFDTTKSIFSLLYPSKTIFYYYSDQNKAKNDRQSLSKLLKSLIPKTQNVDMKKLYFSYWIYNTYKENPLELYKCLTKCSFNPGFKIDIDKKWTIAKTLSAVRFKNNSYVAMLSKEDSSRRGVLNKLSTEVLFSKDKGAWLTKALAENSKLSLKERNTILYSLIPYAQRDALFTFSQKTFFENIDKISKLPQRLQNTFAGNFAPLFCGDYKKIIPITEEQIKGSKWSFGIKKALLKKLDVEERCLKIKAASKGKSS